MLSSNIVLIRGEKDNLKMFSVFCMLELFPGRKTTSWQSPQKVTSGLKDYFRGKDFFNDKDFLLKQLIKLFLSPILFPFPCLMEHLTVANCILKCIKHNFSLNCFYF